MQSCSKENVEPVDGASLVGTWRMESFRYGQDSTNANAWHLVDYNRTTTVVDLYCVNDSRINRSFISKINCAYDETATSSIGVVSSDCARSVFLKDTIWSEQTKYDLIFSSNGQFNWLEEYQYSKHINTVSQPCNTIRYNPETTQKLEASGKWSLDRAGHTLSIDYSPDFSRMGIGQTDNFRITGFSGSLITLKLVGGSGDELRLKKL
jgi:hypothetical protein